MTKILKTLKLEIGDIVVSDKEHLFPSLKNAIFSIIDFCTYPDGTEYALLYYDGWFGMAKDYKVSDIRIIDIPPHRKIKIMSESEGKTVIWSEYDEWFCNTSHGDGRLMGTGKTMEAAINDCWIKWQEVK